MSILNFDFYSEALDQCTSAKIILPQKLEKTEQSKDFENEPAVLYLFHGYSGDNSGWIYFSTLAQIAREQNLAIIMPSAGNSYYSNMINDFNYWDFISEELPRIINSSFKLSKDRDRTFVAGLSMGGYGALKLGLTYPERYSAIGSFSGNLDLIHRYKNTPKEELYKYDRIWDIDKFKGSENDIMHLATKSSKKQHLPEIYQCCGTEDFLYPENMNFKKHIETLPYNHTYEEWAGDHNWDFWEEATNRFVKNFVIPKLTK